MVCPKKNLKIFLVFSLVLYYVASGPNLLNLKTIFTTYLANQHCIKIQHVKGYLKNFKNQWQHNFLFYYIPL
jgi:hypothetical protein